MVMDTEGNVRVQGQRKTARKFLRMADSPLQNGNQPPLGHHSGALTRIQLANLHGESRK
jgi:hypothetical protein